VSTNVVTETVGERLKRLRREQGLAQRDLSGPGISYAYISRIEAGARRPSVKALRMLARKLGVTAQYLETGSQVADSDARELRVAVRQGAGIQSLIVHRVHVGASPPSHASQ